MNKRLLLFTVVPIILFLSIIQSYTNNKLFSLVEEDRSFWDELLKDNSIKNKNLLYASFVAYKDRLNDLSIETFQECINTNISNNILKGIANYYIGKNLFLIGNYEEAIHQFSSIINLDLNKFNYIKSAVMINTAITYYKLNNIKKFKQTLQKVINESGNVKYREIAFEILNQAK